VNAAASRLVVISGCSGGGKSTLIAELAGRGHSVIPEAGRRVVRDALATGSGPVPWDDPIAFAHRVLALAQADRAAVPPEDGWVFLDRSAIDAASALASLTGARALEPFATACRYHPTVFLAPPWPELFTADTERRHSLAEAVAEHERLERDYAALGYRLLTLPRIPLSARADWLISRLD
jgi:predicted ATPase